MVDIPRLEINPLGPVGEILGIGEDEKDPDYHWDGRGAPPSRRAAILWLSTHTAMSYNEAKEFIGKKGTLASLGRKVREEYERRKGARMEREKRDPRRALDAAAEDGALDEDELSSIEALIEAGVKGDTADTRGAPLWPFEGDEQTLADLTVKDRSRSTVDIRDDEGRLTRSGIDQGERDSRRGRPWLETAQGSRTSARYFERDTVEPLKWSAEQRADLQRVLNGIGLYGKDAKIRLGSWTAKDQAIYAELLAAANVEGLTWQEMLAKWKRNPPVDLLDAANGGAAAERAPLVVRHTSPVDIEQTAAQVSRNLIGRVDRDFANSTAAPYNALETQSQTAAYNAGEDGGTVTDAPSVGAFAEDRLRRTDAPEVDSYATLGAFNEVLRELGLAG